MRPGGTGRRLDLWRVCAGQKRPPLRRGDRRQRLRRGDGAARTGRSRHRAGQAAAHRPAGARQRIPARRLPHAHGRSGRPCPLQHCRRHRRARPGRRPVRCAHRPRHRHAAGQRLGRRLADQRRGDGRTVRVGVPRAAMARGDPPRRLAATPPGASPAGAGSGPGAGHSRPRRCDAGLEPCRRARHAVHHGGRPQRRVTRHRAMHPVRRLRHRLQLPRQAVAGRDPAGRRLRAPPCHAPAHRHRRDGAQLPGIGRGRPRPGRIAHPSAPGPAPGRALPHPLRQADRRRRHHGLDRADAARAQGRSADFAAHWPAFLGQRRQHLRCLRHGGRVQGRGRRDTALRPTPGWPDHHPNGRSARPDPSQCRQRGDRQPADADSADGDPGLGRPRPTAPAV